MHALRSPLVPHRMAPLAATLLLAGLSATALAQSAGTAPEPEALLPAAQGRGLLTVDLPNVDVEAASAAVGTMINRQILVDPRVKGTLSLRSERRIPLQDIWRQYLAALRGLGATVVENAGLLKVVPEAEAKLQTGTVQIGAPTLRGDQVVTQIFRLNHENPNNLVAVLRPLISANNTINANVGNGTLVITDYADNLQRLARIIAALDVPAAAEVEVVPVEHALAADLAPLVQRLADATASAAAATTAPGQAQPGGTTVVAEPRSNALIVRTANPARMATAKALIAKLDRPLTQGGPAGSIWVVHLRNADAVKLAEVLRAAMAAGSIGTAGASGGASGSASSGLSALTGAAAAQQNAARPSGAAAGGAMGAGASTQTTTPVAGSPSPSTGGMIQADPSTNSLIISAAEPIYRQLRQVIEQLDTRRAQVYVESMIVKVDAEKAAEFGVQWQGLLGSTSNSTMAFAGTNYGSTGNLVNLSLAAAGVSTSTSTTSSSTASLGQGLNVGIVNKINGTWTLGALANFLHTQTGANILSTPNLVALDNEEAKIVIGQNVPFVTGSFTNTGTGNGAVNPFQTVERKDVGITLRIRSQVGEGGTVRMTVYQESSALRADNSSITDKSAIETTVVVDDGQTMVLGGLLKDEYGDSADKVPGLGDMPVVGALFRSEGRKRTKSNLMLFLRPVVIRTPGAMDQLTVDRYDAIRALQQSAQPQTRPLLTETGAPVLPALPGSAPAATPAASASGAASAPATPTVR